MESTHAPWPTLDGLTSVLEAHRGTRGYVVPMTSADGSVALGNNGDRIMHEVFHRILDRLEISRASSPASADVVIVPPNGALLEVYAFPELLRQRLQGAERLPLVIFPSSALFPHRDPAFMFEGREAPTTWITRERYTFEHLTDRWGASLDTAGVSLVLDHDVVASGHEFVPELIGGAGSGGGVLIAGRRDKEAADIRQTAGGAQAPWTRGRLARLKKAVPYGPWYTLAARLARRGELEAAATGLMEKLPPALQAELGAYRRGPHVDLSAVQYATHDQYRATLRRADAVVTNRLHVALPAAILGKRVVLVEAGYHKLQGVYEQSLAGLSNVTLVGAR